ncbi:MAG: hypothetical protein AMXMBFR33_46030 [Candidatus Xenobia bacterium]
MLLRHLPMSKTGWLREALTPFHTIGWCGVDLFFVLSGYLIAGLLLSDLRRFGKIRLKRFWLRRGLKIWPSYFLIYGAWFALAVLSPMRHEQWTTAWQKFLAGIPNFLFIQNYFPLEARWPHSWSLAIEEQFYLLLPLILILCFQARRSKTEALETASASILVLCVATLLLRAWTNAVHPGDWTALYYPTHLRIDSLAFGVYLRVLQARLTLEQFEDLARRVRLATYLLVVALFICLASVPMETHVWILVPGFTALYLAFGGLVVIAGSGYSWESHLVVLTGLRRLLIYLGTYSYTIYLVHSVWKLFEYLPLTSSVYSWVTGIWPGWGAAVIYLLVSLGGGVLASRLVEQPVLAWRARHIP